ncbi:MAG: tRNA (N(6)-L-threonylcarbamoyladenosine(37)-C(2))-methylthiotransferase MtaB [Clostridia bacterium]|nr:tRNA (N(6)-L-threonylcarbamoyladenosine(37)-C(2))-methylthiotransferase MtaB [Clostridia bacterium]
MEKKTVAFYTLGCKVNQYETNAMKQKFIQEDYEIVDFEDSADVYVVNTCTVTNMSDRKSRQIIRRAKEKNSNAILVVVGCYAQVAKDELEKIDEVDIVLGNQEKKDIISYIKEYENEKMESISDVLYEKEFAEFGQTTYTDKTRAVIKVQDGCDRFCSYCIIPYARGRVRSRKSQEVVSEIEKIAEQGIKEVVITGIHLASYGKDFKPHIPLLELLKQINEIQGIERIRLGSLEPTLMQKEFIEELVKLEKVCNHFHLSLQSGCDETLQRMNRRYTVEEFEKGIELIRKNYPNISLTTDIIVGFPGETKEEFAKTYEFLKRIDFYKMHVFKYSPRKGTKAAVMPNQIPGEIKEERSRKLIELSNKNQEMQNKKYIGKELEVLFEEQDGEYIKGHTTNYIMVYVKTNDITIENTIRKVRITEIIEENLVGIIK